MILQCFHPHFVIIRITFYRCGDIILLFHLVQLKAPDPVALIKVIKLVYGSFKEFFLFYQLFLFRLYLFKLRAQGVAEGPFISFGQLFLKLLQMHSRPLEGGNKVKVIELKGRIILIAVLRCFGRFKDAYIVVMSQRFLGGPAKARKFSRCKICLFHKFPS